MPCRRCRATFTLLRSRIPSSPGSLLSNEQVHSVAIKCRLDSTRHGTARQEESLNNTMMTPNGDYCRSVGPSRRVGDRALAITEDIEVGSIRDFILRSLLTSLYGLRGDALRAFS